jgi:hypothetical protein
MGFMKSGLTDVDGEGITVNIGTLLRQGTIG